MKKLLILAFVIATLVVTTSPLVNDDYPTAASQVKMFVQQ